MRVLMCNSFHYLRGGAERCFLDLSSLLMQKGHEVVPFSMHHERNLPSPYEKYFLSEIDFPTMMQAGSGLRTKLQVAERVVYSREAQSKIEQLILDVKPDIAHVHGIAHETSPSILPVLKRHGIPVVQTLHDYKLLCPNTSFVANGAICEQCKGHRYFNVVRNRCKRGSLAASSLAAFEAYAHRMLRIYERNIDMFISPSEFLAKKVAEFGVDTPVVRIPNFMDLDAFTPKYASEGYCLYVGRLVAVKGIRTLMEAMRQLPNLRLFIAGSGELEDELQDYIKQHSMEHVTLLGHLDKEELAKLMQDALFTVTPSEWYENYPMSVLESLACGTPVIGARIGGIPEIVRDHANGLLFESGNAEDLREKMQYLVEHVDLASEMGRRGRVQIENENSPTQHYRQTMQVYTQVLTASGR